jgi:hypothetical protein
LLAGLPNVVAGLLTEPQERPQVSRLARDAAYFTNGNDADNAFVAELEASEPASAGLVHPGEPLIWYAERWASTAKF